MAKRRAAAVQMVPVGRVTHTPARRRPIGVSKEKYERLKKGKAAMMKRVKDAEFMGDAAAVGGAAVFGWARAKEHIPERFGKVDSGLVIGGGLMLLGFFVGGRVAKLAGDVGVGVASTTAYRMARGVPGVLTESTKGEWDDE